MSTAKDYWDLIKVDYSTISFVVFALAFCGAFIYGHWSAGYALALWFTAFDVLGFRWVLTRHPEDTITTPLANPAYRIIQHGVFFMFILLMLPTNWQGGAIAFILWMTGLCDLVFYWVARVRLSQLWPWLTGWFWIFPGGAIAKYNQTVVSLEGLYYNVAFGLICSGGILLWK